MTKNWFEYDQNRQTIAVWSWPKMTTTNINSLFSTQKDWIWTKVENIKIIYIWSYSHIHFSRCGNINVFYFQSYSLVHVGCCGNIYCIFDFGHIQPDMLIVGAIFILNFGQFHQVNVCRCQFLVMFTDFGHIHSVIFIRSYWFGHIDSVMLTTLLFNPD